MVNSRYQCWRPRTKGKCLVNAKGHALINPMAGNPAKLKAETLDDPLADVEAEVLVETMCDTLKKLSS